MGDVAAVSSHDNTLPCFTYDIPDKSLNRIYEKIIFIPVLRRTLCAASGSYAQSRIVIIDATKMVKRMPEPRCESRLDPTWSARE